MTCDQTPDCLCLWAVVVTGMVSYGEKRPESVNVAKRLCSALNIDGKEDASHHVYRVLWSDSTKPAFPDDFV